MRHFLQGAVAIGVGTLLEALRSRLLLISMFFALVLVTLSVAAASVSFGEQSRLIIDVGLAAASVFGVLIAISLTISSFAGEIRQRTAYALLARPIPRWTFVLGKYLGLLFAMELVVILMVFATAITVWLYGDPVPSVFWAALWLTCVEVAVAISVALLFSSMAVPVLAACYSVGVVIVGSFASDILQFALKLEEQGKPLGWILRRLYYFPPDLEKFSLRLQAANGIAVPTDILVAGSFYGLAYILAALILAMWIFSYRKTV